MFIFILFLGYILVRPEPVSAEIQLGMALEKTGEGKPPGIMMPKADATALVWTVYGAATQRH